LLDLLTAGRRQRPADYETVVRGLAKRYSGDQQGIVKAALRDRYPQTGDKIPIDPVNWLRFFARQDSGVYVEPAQRELFTDDDVAVDHEDPRAEAFDEALEDIGINVLMPEIERRANTGARAAVVMLGYRKVDDADDGKPVAHIYWPHDVVTINHPSAPDAPESLWFVAFRQARAQTSSAVELWWVWSRTFTEHDDGTVAKYGPWTHRRVSEDGHKATPSEVYDGLFPGVFFRTEPPSGGFWPEPDRDVLINVDSLNVSRSNRQHVIDMQAHAMLIYAGTMRETSELVSGPSTVVQVGNGETIQYLTAGANHVAIETSATRDLHELGVSRGNSPDAYSVEPGAPQSGVSRMIANAPHEQRVSEMRPIYKHTEEQYLLPVLIDILERYSPSAPSSFGSAYASVSMGMSKTYEDDNAKAQRVLDLKLAGLIDDADARVMLGLSSNRAEAEEYLSDVSVVDAPSPLRSLLSSDASMVRETTVDVEEEVDVVDVPVTETTPAAVVDAGITAAAATGDVQGTALNGAQVESLLSIIQLVSSGALPASTARALMVAAFPAISTDTLDEMLAGLDGFKPPVPDVVV